MKAFALVAVLVAFVFVPVMTEAQEAPEVPAVDAQEVEVPAVKTAEAKAQLRVAVVFQKSVRNREVLEKALQETLRDAGYQPVWSGRNALRSERDWARLGPGIDRVLVVSDARVTYKRTQETSPTITIAKYGRIGARVRWAKTIVSLDAKMVNAADRAVTGFGHGEGDSSSVEKIGISTGGVIDIVKTSGLYRQQSRQDMVYKAAKGAATEAIRGLR